MPNSYLIKYVYSATNKKLTSMTFLLLEPNITFSGVYEKQYFRTQSMTN